MNEDTTGPALADIRSWYQGPVAIATDLLVIDVSKTTITQRQAVVSDFSWYPKPKIYNPNDLAPAKYPTPTAQLNSTLPEHVIPDSAFASPTK